MLNLFYFDRCLGSVQGEDATILGGIAADFVRCLAAFKSPPSGVDGYVLGLVHMLPEPQTDGREKNIINAYSVCMPPTHPTPGSPSSCCRSDSTVLANACKALITYLDSGSVLSVLNCGGMERIVCLLANSGGIGGGEAARSNARKNAGSVLARLVKGNAKAMERCRELRGMEILVELGKTGKL